jgi:hypothetical protein
MVSKIPVVTAPVIRRITPGPASITKKRARALLHEYLSLRQRQTEGLHMATMFVVNP